VSDTPVDESSKSQGVSMPRRVRRFSADDGMMTGVEV
jgi:hypothetical protein